jgi:hypothetical protein
MEIKIRSVVRITKAQRKETAKTGRNGGFWKRLFAKKYIPRKAITVGTSTVEP